MNVRSAWCSALLGMAFVATIAATGRTNDAASFPSRTVQIVVPFPAGGTTDLLTRTLAQIVSKEWKQTIVVDNRAGATGAIGGEYVWRQPADGHTLLIATPTSHTVMPLLRKDLPYDPLKNFTPVTLLNINPNILVVNPRKVPVKTVGELIEYLRKNPGKLTFASTGIGSASHLAAELFKLMTGTDMVHVPYRGNAPAMNDLVAGNVDLAIDNMASVMAHVRSGSIRALGTTTVTRTALAPDIATVAETVPGFEAQTWNGIVVRTETPQDIVAKIAASFNAAMQDADVIKRLNDVASIPVGNSPSEFLQFINADKARWGRVAGQILLGSGPN